MMSRASAFMASTGPLSPGRLVPASALNFQNLLGPKLFEPFFQLRDFTGLAKLFVIF